MAHSLKPVTIQPVQGNACPVCLSKIAEGEKRVWIMLPDCECTFPVPKINGPLCPNGGYTREQREADLEFVDMLEQLECSAALAAGLIGGYECLRREKRFARMRQKIKAIGSGFSGETMEQRKTKTIGRVWGH